MNTFNGPTSNGLRLCLVLLCVTFSLACQLTPVSSVRPGTVAEPVSLWTLPATPVPVSTADLFAKGDVALWAGDFASAERAYREALPLTAYPGPVYSRLAFLYALQPERWRESLSLAQKATDIARDDAEVWAYVALAHRAHGHVHLALEAAQQALVFDGGNLAARLALADAYLGLNQMPQALSAAEDVLVQQDDHVLARIIVARCYLKAGDIDQAIAVAEQTLAQSPNFPEARLALVDAHMAAWEYVEARAYLASVLQQAPESVWLLLAQARLDARQGDLDAALASLVRAESLAPESPRVLTAVAWLHMQREEIAVALTKFQQAVSLDADSVPAQIGLGLVRTKDGACMPARLTLERALHLMPHSAWAHLGLARSLDCLGQDSQAVLEHYQRAAEFAYGAPDILREVAVYMAHQARHTEAIAAYRAVLMRDLAAMPLYVALGYEHLHSLSGLRMAEGNFLHALALDPDQEDALLNLGEIYNDLGVYEKALEMFHRALDVAPQSARVSSGLGRAYTMLDRYEQALGPLEYAVQRDPASAEAYLYLARVYRVAMRYAEAGAALQNYVELNPQDIPTASVLRNTAHSLSNRAYWVPEKDVSSQLMGLFEASAALKRGTLGLSVVNVEVETQQKHHQLHVVLALDSGLPGYSLQREDIAAAVACSAALVPRVLPPLDSGLLLVVKDAVGVPLYEVRVSPDIAQDVTDGFLQDYTRLMQSVDLRDLRYAAFPSMLPSPHTGDERASSEPEPSHNHQADRVRSDLLGFGGYPSEMFVQSALSTQVGGPYEVGDATLVRESLRSDVWEKALTPLEFSWQKVYAGEMGPHFIRTYLCRHNSPDVAQITSEGWQEDQQFLFENWKDGRALLIWYTDWTSSEAARKFVLAHRAIFDEPRGYREVYRVLKAGDRTLRWTGQNRVVYLHQQGAHVWFIVAREMADIDQVLSLLRMP